nr:uncharacterized protein LOC113828319 [Penaeus vannamei]
MDLKLADDTAMPFESLESLVVALDAYSNEAKLLSLEKFAVVLLFASVVCAVQADDDDSQGAQARLLAQFGTTTVTHVSTVTVMAHYTCAKCNELQLGLTKLTKTKSRPVPPAVASTTCSGRRRRRRVRLDIGNNYNPGAYETLAGSVVNTEIEQPEEGTDRGKLFTVWRTSISTLMITSTSYNRDITVSVSLYCTNASMLYEMC